jgi:hypothetical protein
MLFISVFILVYFQVLIQVTWIRCRTRNSFKCAENIQGSQKYGGSIHNFLKEEEKTDWLVTSRRKKGRSTYIGKEDWPVAPEEIIEWTRSQKPVGVETWPLVGWKKGESSSY